jgi:hypothetical protein
MMSAFSWTDALVMSLIEIKEAGHGQFIRRTESGLIGAPTAWSAGHAPRCLALQADLFEDVITEIDQRIAFFERSTVLRS